MTPQTELTRLLGIPQELASTIDPMTYHLRPGEWIERCNGTDLKRGSGPFKVTTTAKIRATRKAKRC